MLNHQHTPEGEAIASLTDQLPDAIRADWLGAIGQWLAQYRRGIVAPIPTPAIQQTTPPDPVDAETEPVDNTPDDDTRSEAVDSTPNLCLAEICVGWVLAEQAEGERRIGAKLAKRAGYEHDSIRKYLGPSKPLTIFCGVKNKGGYYMDEQDREWFRATYPKPKHLD